VRLSDQLEAINNGTPAEDIARDDQDPAFLKRMAKTYKARQANPRKCRTSTRRTPSRRKVPAANALGGSYFQQEDARLRAEAEKVSRVNEKRVIPWNVGGEMRMLEVT
jgi:hypothetical protein